MKNFIIALLIFAVWTVIALWVYSLFTMSSTVNADESTTNGLMIENDKGSLITSEISTNDTVLSDIKSNSIDVAFIKEEKQTTVQAANFKIFDHQKEIIIEYNEAIIAMINSDSLVIPKSLHNFTSKIAAYLELHPDNEIHINSFFNPIESIETPNHGVKRGLKIKDQLVAANIPSQLIVINAILDTAPLIDDTILSKSINITFAPINEERIANLKPELPQSSIHYFEYEYGNLISNRDLISLGKNIKEQLDANPSFKVVITGHTDNIGADSENYSIGLKKSRQLKWYLVNKVGLDRNLIEATSQGEAQPIVPNTTTTNRNKNARLEISFKE